MSELTEDEFKAEMEGFIRQKFPAEPTNIDAVQEQINKAFKMGVAFERERCAKAIESLFEHETEGWTKDDFAGFIRALSP